MKRLTYFVLKDKLLIQTMYGYQFGNNKIHNLSKITSR
jgi:hypothetical protein